MQTVDMRIDRVIRLQLDRLALQPRRRPPLTQRQLHLIDEEYNRWQASKNFSRLLLPGTTPGSNLDNGDLLLLGITVT
jgi:hypothetical protein